MTGGQGRWHGRDVTVLHVDDDPAFLEMVGTFLEREDDRLDVETAESAAEGVERLAEGGVDCVVSDYDIPERNGIAFLERVREDHPDLPFILFTGKGSEEVASDAISAGVTDYLQKQAGDDRYALLANRIRNAAERTRAQRERRRNERHFEAVLNDPKMLISVLDPDGTVRKVNETAMELVDAEYESVVGEPFWETPWWEPERRPDLREWIDRAAAGEYVDYEIEHPTREGDWRHVSGTIRPVADEAGHVVSLLVAGRDRSAFRTRERDLELLRERMEFVLEATDSHIWIADFETNETEIYGPTESLYGVGGEKVGDTEYFFEHLVHPEDRAAVAQAFDNVGRGERRHLDVEFRTHPDLGERRWLHSEGVVRSEGETPRLIGLTTDVTGRKQREEALERQNDRLEEFAGIVSHDLRNPLNVAEGRLTLARGDCDSEHLDAVSDAHARMKTLIDDLLAIAREGRTVTDLTTVEVAELIERCWQHVATADATLVVEADVTVRADRSRLRQLVENLVRNAVEHGSTSSQPQADDAVEHGGDGVTVTVGALPDGFYVADDGPGIPAAERERIFEMGHTGGDGGTGLGLAIVAQIVEAHDWSIRATESEAGGVRFEITDVDVVDS